MSTKQERDWDLVQKITGTLERAIQKGILPHAVEGYLTPDEQHAVRILRSRVRLLNRIYTSQYGIDSAKEKALQELSLKQQDDGSLINLYDRRHSVGRLSCNACENQYETGMPVSKARVCQLCKAGIQHCCRVPYTENLGTNPGLGTPSGSKTSVGGLQQEINQNVIPIDKVLWVCDSCKVESCG